MEWKRDGVFKAAIKKVAQTSGKVRLASASEIEAMVEGATGRFDAPDLALQIIHGMHDAGMVLVKIEKQK